MIWNDKKSILRHGNRDIKCDDVVPADVLEIMGKDRVKQLTDDKRLVKGSAPKAPTEKETLIAAAKGMGLSVASNISIKNLKTLIEDEGKRVALLKQAKELQLDVADDTTTTDLTAAIEEANAS